MKRTRDIAAMKKRQEAKAVALRERLEAQKAAARRKLDGRPERPRRWRVLLLLLALLLLMLLVPECYCTEVPLEPEPEGASEGSGAVLENGPSVEPEQPLPGGRVPRTNRPQMPLPEPEALPWLEAFELQVSARSPRLAACFDGAQRPGALRWTALLVAATGTVSDHTLEPVLDSDALGAAQRQCVTDVLSMPAYFLAGTDQRSTPTRVSLVIEF